MANPALIGAAIQGGSGLLGSIISNIGQRKAQRRAFRHDRSMAEFAYGKDLDMWNRQSQWNMDMWNLQNQYNLPANAMQRLRDAGLNPNLVATAGASGGQAASVQPASSPRYQQVRANYDFPPVNIPNILGMYNSFRMADAQIDNIRSQAEVNKERALHIPLMRQLTGIQSERQMWQKNYDYEISKYSGQMAKTAAELQMQKLRNALQDEKIKTHMVGRTGAESGLKQMEYEFFKNIGLKGMRDIAPFLQLLLRNFRQ